MNVLVIGGGGREHAIIKKLSESREIGALYCAPGNGGIAQNAVCVDIKATDIHGIVDFAIENKINLVVVAPDDPLAMGMVDRLQMHGLKAFGPTKAAAEIESSKAFAKNLMRKYNIPTADYAVFEDYEAARAYIETRPAPMVVKADGLALGKGVLICETREQALEAAQSMLLESRFGKSGSRIVVEEFMTGPEVSVLAFCDGKTVVPMVSAQDHKRAFDGDRGLNTGGMGTFSPSRVYTPQLAEQCMETIFIPTVRAMQQEGRPFKGVLYFGLMLTPDGPKVLEYNARFGDPETQVVLPRLKSDLLEIFLACIDGTLDQTEVLWYDNAAVCVVMASGGYPEKYQTGYPISGLNAFAGSEDVFVYHAGTKKAEDGTLRTAGGRVLGVTAVAKNLDCAIEKAYAAVSLVSFQDAHYRRDIGVK